ncbi:hypothetical protein NMD1_01056 [Novosphingobium sp. MD-1]|nr:hypothetical protein NMD1_01056 [Novosphingobium sp. MD-1]
MFTGATDGNLAERHGHPCSRFVHRAQDGSWGEARYLGRASRKGKGPRKRLMSRACPLSRTGDQAHAIALYESANRVVSVQFEIHFGCYGR